MGNAELGGNLCHSWGQFLKNPSNTSTPPPSTLHPSHQVITCQPVPDPRVFPPGVSQHLRRGPSTHDPAPETVRGARAGRVVSRVGQGAHLDLLRPDEVHLIRTGGEDGSDGDGDGGRVFKESPVAVEVE